MNRKKTEKKGFLNAAVAIIIALALVMSGTSVCANYGENEQMNTNNDLYVDNSREENVTLEISEVGPGRTDPSSGIYTYPNGTVVDIEACPFSVIEGRAFFMYWTGDVPIANKHDNPIEITMNEDKEITANFWGYSIQPMCTGCGYVEVTLIHIDPLLIELKSFACPGWSFSHWAGDINATGNPISIKISPDMHIIAVFESDAGEPVIKLELPPFPDPFPFFRVYITNIGNANATDVEWSFRWYGGWIPFERLNNKARIDTGEIAVIPPRQGHCIGSIKFGFGRVAIIISAECVEGSSNKIVIEGMMMGFFLIIPPQQTF